MKKQNTRHRKRNFWRLFMAMVLLNCVLIANSAICIAKTEQAPVKKSKPKYRVIFNQDCSRFFDDGGSTPEGVQNMVDVIADGGADVLLINPNTQVTNYPSKVWQRFWDGYKEGDRSFFGSIPDDVAKRRAHEVGNMAKLAKQGDYLKIALTRCRTKGIIPGITLRMNDMHDAPWADSHRHSRFYNENPQFQLLPNEAFKNLEGRSWGGKGLDYAHEEVREHYLKLIRELAQDYDFDVLELDFLRFPYYFNRNSADQDKHCEIMTGFLRDVRQILDSTGRHIDFMPRVASSPGAARILGFDVQAWAKEGIVDGITVGNFLTTCWDAEIEKFRSLVGTNIAIYVATEVDADSREGLPVRHLPNTVGMLRGFTAGYLAIGADGVNTFSYFLSRYLRPVTDEEFYSGLREMRSLEEARGKSRIHLLNAGLNYLVECDTPDQVPVTIRRKTSRQFDMLLASEAKGQKVQAFVVFEGETTPDDLWLRIGSVSVGHSIEFKPGQGKTELAVFNVPAGVIKDGRNHLFVITDKVDVKIQSIEVHVW